MATQIITVQQGQNLKDLGIQYYGSVEGWFRIADLNGVSLTEKVKPGDQVIVDVVENETVKYLALGGHVPATMTDDLLGGIGYMEIGKDFKVS